MSETDPTPPREGIMAYLVRQLQRAGPRRFQGIADLTGVNFHMIRKIHCGATTNPTVKQVQPLLFYFADVAAHRRSLPVKPPPKPRGRPRIDRKLAAPPALEQAQRETAPST